MEDNKRKWWFADVNGHLHRARANQPLDEDTIQGGEDVAALLNWYEGRLFEMARTPEKPEPLERPKAESHVWEENQ